MKKTFLTFKLASILLICFLLSGCAVKDKLHWLDQKIGESFKSFQSSQVDKTINVLDEKPLDSKSLTDEQKEEIDKWLEENDYNRYGDPIDTVYMGGTPLFNEATGESIERFEYILEKQPDILKIINN